MSSKSSRENKRIAAVNMPVTDEEHQLTLQEVEQLKKMLVDMQAGQERYKQRADKLALALLEKEKKMSDLQRYEYNFRKTSDQRTHLENANKTLLQEIRSLHLERDQIRQSFRVMEESLKCQHDEKQEAIEEARALYSQFELLKKICADFKHQLECSQARLQVSEEIIIRLKSDLASLNEHKEEVVSLREKLTDWEEQQKKLEDLKEVQIENLRLLEKFNQVAALQNEAEARLKIAQQHLVKKVKETAELNDKVHAHELLIQDLQNTLLQARTSLSEQQQTIDSHLLQEKRLQHQLLESSKAAEMIANRWEEKYFKIYEKWQENEIRVKEFRKIQEKHTQMLALLTNIGGIFGTPLSLPQSMSHSDENTEGRCPLQIESTGEVLRPFQESDSSLSLHKNFVKEPYQNLFEMPKQPPRAQPNLE